MQAALNQVQAAIKAAPQHLSEVIAATVWEEPTLHVHGILEEANCIPVIVAGAPRQRGYRMQLYVRDLNQHKTAPRYSFLVPVEDFDLAVGDEVRAFKHARHEPGWSGALLTYSCVRAIG